MLIRLRFLRYAAVVAYTLGLALFYYRYVPLVLPYQLVLAPILAVIVFLTWRNVKTGALIFLFVFPLINGLPYFFKLYEPLPQAPAALILSLFFLLGILLRPDVGGETADVKNPLEGPLALFAGLVAVSALVTFLRYANFYPFATSGIYELVANRHGVRAGGALMSIVFSALNYLTGIALYLVFVRHLRDAAWRRKALFVLGTSTVLATVFALIQHFGHLALGNNPSTVHLGLINGTFKDALSFGTFLSMVAPLGLAAAAAFRSRPAKTFAIVLALLAVAVLPFTGSKSGVIGLGAGLAVLAVFGASGLLRSRNPNTRKKLVAASLILFVIGVGVIYIAPGYLRNAEKLPAIVERFQNAKDMFNVRVALLWKHAIRMIRDYPVTGVGVGAFIIELANYGDVYERPDVTPESAENHVLQVGSELGLVAVIVVFVIAFAIIRQAGRGLSVLKPKLSERYLLIGAVAGFVAFIVNAQAHSFIGSFEIKYAMWFIIALIVALTPPAPSPAGPLSKILGGSNRTLKTTGAILLVSLGVVHLWNSTHSLSLESRTTKYGLNREFGLDKLEKTADGRDFRWTREYGGIPVKLEKSVLSLPVHASHPDIRKKPVQVKIYLVKDFFKHKTFLKEITLSQNDWQDVALSVPPEDIGQEAILLLKIDRTWNPLKTKGVPDPRNLGVAVGKIEFRNR